VGKTLLHGDVLMWLMKTLLTSRCVNQRGAGQPHTFRHSYAMHMLYAGIPLKVLQSLMGHKSISSTEVYTKVFALDVAARHRVQFQMPGDEAVALLKGNGR
ncbi:tyrosine-type recombinase/integrase, partial [Klebsiella michiganensis]|uniref:tyrosine-type recombinase/integrase n=1 Tax=Klebsiella michiganensis TaxID=1134687 RepID=UPI001CB8522E